MDTQTDFKELNQILLAQVRDLLPQWLPGGKFIGDEYVCSDITGGSGNSLSFNTKKGYGADFESGEKFGDMISLYATINRLSQGEARLSLLDKYDAVAPAKRKPTPSSNPDIGKPPKGATRPSFRHYIFGPATKIWHYMGPDSETYFYVARYDKAGKKHFVPWSWDFKKKMWANKHFPKPRPLYNLPDFKKKPTKPILIVEGEKAADAAMITVGDRYVVTTWPCGSNSWQYADWDPCNGRDILFWPDADEAGIKCGKQISTLLLKIAKEVKLLDVSDIKEKGWDAADAKFEFSDFVQWAKKRVDVIVSDKQAQVLHIVKAPPEIPPPMPLDLDKFDIGSDEPDPHLVQKQLDRTERLRLEVNSNGTPISNIDNVLRVLHADTAEPFVWFDTFHSKLFTNFCKDGIKEWSDSDEINLTTYFQRELGMRTLKETVLHSGIISYAYAHKKNEVHDYINSLSWDKVPRIKRFFHDYVGTDNSLYIQGASMNFWISLVARAFVPGCKVDTMIILEGEQGTLKSTLLSAIGGKWFGELNENIQTKDFFLALQGKLLIEISELDAFSKAEVSAIKKVISTCTDRFRVPFGRNTQDYPRQCVFAGSTNENAYLRDPTGARRFWPIKIGDIKIDLVLRDRDQFFAEAAHYFHGGSKWWEMPDEVKAIQASRRQADAWEPTILPWLEGRKIVTITEVLTDCLGVEIPQFDTMKQRRVGSVLRANGWKVNTLRDGGRVYRGWEKQ